MTDLTYKCHWNSRYFLPTSVLVSLKTVMVTCATFPHTYRYKFKNSCDLIFYSSSWHLHSSPCDKMKGVTYHTNWTSHVALFSSSFCKLQKVDIDHSCEQHFLLKDHYLYMYIGSLPPIGITNWKVKAFSSRCLKVGW